MKQFNFTAHGATCDICGKHRIPTVSHARCSQIRQKQMVRKPTPRAKPIDKSYIDFISNS